MLKYAANYQLSDGPTDAISREQMATIMWRYAKCKGYSVSLGEGANNIPYTDAEAVSEWAISAVQWACGYDMIQGIKENALDPSADASRVQIAAFLSRFCESIK